MNSDILQGNWKKFRGEIMKQWGKLTDDDLDVVNGQYEQLLGRIQERYGWERERATEEVNRFFERQSLGDF